MCKIIKTLIIILINCKVCISWAIPIFDIDVSYTGPVGGLYTYNYTLRVDSISTEYLVLWNIYPTVELYNPATTITKPTGWEDPFYGQPTPVTTAYITWYTLGSGIAPGNYLSGFSYQSYGPPGWVSCELQSSTNIIIDKRTIGATSEPYTLILFGSGFLIGMRLLRKKFL
jgi:hypothetical protein